jgi:hypothetical protein
MAPIFFFLAFILVFFLGPILVVMALLGLFTRVTGMERRPEMLMMFMPRLANTDPVWRDTRIMKRAEEVYMAVQQAWRDRDHSAASAFMTPGLIEAHQAQLAALEARQERSVIEAPKVHVLNIVHAADYEDDTRDEVWVQIGSSAIDYNVDHLSGVVVRGDKEERTRYDEVWKFRRHEDTWRVDDVSPFSGFQAVPSSFSEVLNAGVDRR